MITALLVANSLASVALSSPLTSSVELFGLFRRAASGCSATGQASCHNTTIQNTCCFESPGGLLLQTQFWDTDPSTGPTNSWTIHGLWPDNCDETFESSCDSSRAYTDISGLLTNAGATDTLSFMKTVILFDHHYRQARDFLKLIDRIGSILTGDDESFWEHEWSKHGTCMSTLEPDCLDDYSTGDEAVAFFVRVVSLFKGVVPALNCDGNTLNQIYWYFNLKGSIINGTFVAIDAPSKGSCSTSGISYPPKSGSATTTTTSATSTPTNSGDLPAKATITASRVSGNLSGGLLSAGTWSTQTLATYTLSGNISSFTMKSSKGDCGISSGVFSCGSSVSVSTFSAVNSGNDILLAFNGSSAFSSDTVPSGTTQEAVYTGSSHDQDFTLVIKST
ncbi:RNase Gf29 [Phellopilus nigrolimitatus]|nr:RNase Gf29 [Phellopilus nigrolimitatus]